MKYTLDGDILTLFTEYLNDDVPVEEETAKLRRSDYDSYDANDSKPVEGGSVIETQVTNGFVAGVISIVCPEGWYGYKNALSPDMIMFTTDPNSSFASKNITVSCDISECVTIDGERLPENHEIEGRIWEGAIDEENNILQLATYMGGNAVKVVLSGSDAEDDGAALKTIFETLKLTWETEESALGICEGKDADFFELRSMKLSSSFSNRASLQTFGYDWCILFRSNGTVTARLDGSVTRCIFGFGSVVANGTWAAGVMTFTNGDESIAYEYTLDGDRIAVVLGDDTPTTFHRSNTIPPDDF
jgi:hypothetical protein